MLMLVVLSACMLAGLGATAVQSKPAYADKEDCEKTVTTTVTRLKTEDRV